MPFDPFPPPLDGGYDPDYTVWEAMQAGQAIRTDGQTAGMVHGVLCDYRTDLGQQVYIWCHLEVGHKGNHVSVGTWSGDHESNLKHLQTALHNLKSGRRRVTPETDSAIKDVEARIAELEPQVAEIVRAREQEAYRAHVEAVKRERDAAKEAKRLAAQKAADAAKDNKVAKKVYTTEVLASDPLGYWALDKQDSMVAKSTKKQPTWPEMTRTSKRNKINPKGQR